MLTWNVYRHNINADKIEIYNIFSHVGIMNELVKIKKKCAEFDAFSEEVKNLLMYQCWARCEWEVIVSAWAGGKAEEKIDVYEQILMNWDNFIKYVWDNRNLIKKVEVR